MNFSNIDKRQVKKVENILNNRPRKKLEYSTPNEIANKRHKTGCFVAFISRGGFNFWKRNESRHRPRCQWPAQKAHAYNEHQCRP